MPAELPELVITSKTQSKETIEKILKDQGYEPAQVEVESTTDAPAQEPTPEPVAETPPAGADDAGEGEEEEVEETPPAVTPGSEQPPAKKSKPGSVKLKEKLQAQTEENARIKAENEELKRKLATPPAPPVTPPPSVEPPAPTPAAAAPPAEPELVAPVEPKWEDFENDENQLAAFTRATSRHEIAVEKYNTEKARREKERSEAPVREATARAEAETRQVVDTWNQRATVVRQKHPDLFDKLAAIPPTPVMSSVVMREEDGPELAYWLANNPDELRGLNEATKTDANSTPAQVNTAMGKMYQAVGRIRYIMSQEQAPDAGEETPPAETPPAPPAPTPPATPPPTAATPPKKPAPVAPVGARGSSTVRKLSQMTEAELRALPPDEYRRMREAEAK